MRPLRLESRLMLPVGLLLLSACAGLPRSESRGGFDPRSVLSAQEQQAVGSAEQARAALQDVRAARERYRAALLLEQIDCYRGIFVSGCLERVAARKRQLEARLDEIEVRANQRIRDLAAIDRSEREALSLRQELAQEEVRLASEARHRERYQERQRQAQEAEMERQLQAPELRRREQAQRERQLERERAFEQRKLQAAPAR